MGIMGATKVSTNPVSDLLSAEQPSRLDDGALAMDPLGLNRVEPGTLDRQIARQDPHAVPLLLDLSVLCTDPSAHAFTHMPGGVVPDQPPHPHTGFLQPRTAPAQELLGDGADRPALDETQPDLLRLSDLAQQHAVTGQRLGIGIVLGFLLLNQAQRAVRGVRPGMQVRAGQATPPRLIGEAQRPVWMPLCKSDQAVTLPFFRAYPGSGLVIQCLARSQLMPSRSKVVRMVSPLTRVATMPSATLTWAAKSNVQTLVGLPKSR